MTKNSDGLLTFRLARNLNASQIEDLASLHADNIPNGFLTTLGDDFLNLLYSAINLNKDCEIFVAQCNEEIIGFLASSRLPTGILKTLVINFTVRLAFVLCGALTSFVSISKIIETLRASKGRPSNKSTCVFDYQIINLCVKAEYQNRKIGRTLLNQMIDHCHANNLSSVKIVTGASQISARRLYLSAGAEWVADLEIHKGVKSLLFLLDLRKK
ncbi:MAG: GNAT family N-acetyltransferase [Alphaproteobacteria bacterium]